MRGSHQLKQERRQKRTPLEWVKIYNPFKNVFALAGAKGKLSKDRTHLQVISLSPSLGLNTALQEHTQIFFYREGK